jgi:integrase
VITARAATQLLSCPAGLASIAPGGAGVNPRQARALLAAVRVQKPSGPRLVAFFGVMYYAGLRPEEAVSLRKENLRMPSRNPDSDSWGELEFENASPDAGHEWTDDGDHRERRQFKHRARGDSRPVPAHPELVALLREHLEEFGTAPDGRLFNGVRGGELPTITYRRAWIAARRIALTPAEYA